MTLREQITASQVSLVEAIYGHNDEQTFDSKRLAVYQRSLAANASRALAVSFPTIQELIGDEGFTLLAKDFIHDHPLVGGDWGEWGKEFPVWIANNEKLNEYPYLQDCAQLDWLCHCCERSADETIDMDSLNLLEQADPYKIRFRYFDSLAILQSSYPVADIWEAHHSASPAGQSEDDLLALAAENLANNIGQTALIWRPEWKACVQEINKSMYRWLQYTLQGKSIGSALDHMHGADFSFETWLPDAVNNRMIAGIARIKRINKRY